MRWALGKATTTTFALALIVVVLLGAGTYRLTRYMEETTSWVSHTHLVRFQISELHSSLLDVETGQRGFLLTEEETYLVPIARGTDRTPQQLATLRRLTADNPVQQIRLDSLAPIVAERLAFATATIDVRRSQGLQASAAMVATGRGKALSDEIQRRLSEMDAEEARLAELRQATSDQIMGRALTLLPVAAVTSLLMVLMGLALVNRAAAGRELALQGVRASELRFRSLVSATAQLVWSADPSGEVVGPLPAWQAFTGQAESEIQGTGWVTAVHPDDAPEVLKAWRAAIDRRIPCETACRIRRHDGLYRYFDLRGVPVIDDDIVVEWVATCTDTHDRTVMEEALRESDERLNTALAASGVGTWNWDIVSNAIVWDDYIHPLFGLVPGTFPGRYEDFLSLLHPDERDRISQEVAASVQEDAPYDTEYQVVWPDGSAHWLGSRGKVYRDATGRPMRMTGVCWDITALRTAASATRESQEALERTLDSAHMGYWSLDLVTHAATRSLRHDQTFGYDTLLPEWTYEMFLAHVHAEDRERVDRLFQQGVAAKTQWEFECRIRRHDGEPRWIWAHGNVFTDEGGVPVRMLGVVRDITARKQAESQLQRYAEELQRSNQELEHFAYVASHDLQEPLRTVASFSQLLASRYRAKLDEDADTFIQFITDGAVRMQTLINDLLTYSRIGSRGNALAPTATEETLQAVLADLALAIEETRSVVTHDPLPIVAADGVQLRQLLQNLVGNAIKFRQPGQPARIHLGATREGTEWHFSVRDHGIGIEPQYFDRIFVIFQRLHAREEYPGTGIGLAVCKKIVERHGGRIWLESDPDHGTTFHFTLLDGDPTDATS